VGDHQTIQGSQGMSPEGKNQKENRSNYFVNEGTGTPRKWEENVSQEGCEGADHMNVKYSKRRKKGEK